MKKALVVLVAVAMVFSCATAFAEIWPNRTPTVYIGFGAGGGTDTAIRPIIASISEILGETINCVNMDGANSATACDYVLSQPHDGYSMFATGSGAFASFTVYGYSESMWQDWVSYHAYTGPVIYYANVDSGITTAQEFFDYLAEGNLMGVGGFGNGPHTQFEAICAATGFESPEYSLFGSCADTGVGVIAGDVMVGGSTMSAVIDYIQGGMITPLFVTSAEPVYFDEIDLTCPSVTEVLEGCEDIPSLLENWIFMIPRDAPEEIINALNEALGQAVQTQEIADFCDQKAFTIMNLTGEEADKALAQCTSGIAWTIYNADLGKGNPADHGIPTLDEFDWDTVKLTCDAYK